ncbi:MAG: DUF1679 domain-containing protein [Verrucomicrobia bacterium]|nr:MAG: DUF1679 domain-containing protein [Verrucomicrobiota bacterium]
MKNVRPAKAVLLAAGFGTRLLPLTREVPKPLLPLWGRTLLDRALDLLASFGVREVLINLHHGAEAIRAHLEKNPRNDLQVQFSFEPKILGTGGALVRAKNFLPDDAPFWLFNADVAADLDPQPLLDDFAQHQPLAALWLVRDIGPRTVEIKKGQVVNLTSPRAGQPDLFTFSGLHLLSKRILDFLPRKAVFAPITPVYTKAMQHGAVVRGVVLQDSFWFDVGTPANYLAAHNVVSMLHGQQRRGGRLFDPAVAGVRGRDFVAFGADVRVGRGAQLRQCVVCDGAQIAAGVTVRGAVIGRDTVVRHDVQGLVGRADRWLDAVEQKTIRKIGFAPEATVVSTPGPRGSQRVFMRLQCGEQSAMLMRYDPARVENTLFVRHARFLKKVGVSGPEILLDLPRYNLCLVEDLGDVNLLDLQRGITRERLIALYEVVLGVVMQLHVAGGLAVPRTRLRRMPDFGPDLYRWERDYFAEHMLARRCAVPPATITKIKQELAQIAWRLDRPTQVLLHRDLQSSNVLWHKKRLHLIDFQGLRFGPAAYDLASLLCDPYADLPKTVQQQLLTFYERNVGYDLQLGLFWWAAVQRLAQALGAYAKLAAQPETGHFADHIPAALRQLHRALGELPGFPVLRDWVNTELGRNK